MNYLKITDAVGNVYRLAMPFTTEIELVEDKPPALNAELIYAQDLSSGLGDVQMHMPGDADSYTVIDAPTRGGKAVRHYMPANAPGFPEYSGTLKHRLMLRHGISEPLLFNPEIEYWVGFGMYLPVGYPMGGWESDATPGTAAFCFDFQVGKGCSEINALIVNKELLIRLGGIDFSQQDLLKYPVMTGIWYDIVLNFVRDPNGGKLNCWINGIKEISQIWNCNDYASIGAKDPYFRTGIYWGPQQRPDAYTQIFTPVKVATGGSDGHGLVMPS